MHRDPKISYGLSKTKNNLWQQTETIRESPAIANIERYKHPIEIFSLIS